MLNDTLLRVESLKKEAVQAALIFMAKNKFQELKSGFIATGIISEETLEVVDDKGVLKDLWKGPNEVGDALLELRELMFTGEHGAWYSAIVTVQNDGNYQFEFDYNGKPEWGIWPTDEAYIEDLAKFPRPWQEVPQWHPVRKHFDEESWRRHLNAQESRSANTSTE